MENKQKNTKAKVTSFRTTRRSRHFTGETPPVSDVLGSYTGTPVNMGAPLDYDDLIPVQDADDL